MSSFITIKSRGHVQSYIHVCMQLCRPPETPSPSDTHSETWSTPGSTVAAVILSLKVLSTGRPVWSNPLWGTLMERCVGQ